jgi:cobalt-zinc-cadmium resistance protein CzcA
MLERLIAWSLNHRLLVLIGAAVVAALGGLALANLKIDAFPDITPVQVQINTQAPGMLPEEIERQITFPIELALNGMPAIDEVRSISMFGLSQVIVTFADGTDIYFARELILERLVSVELPDGIDRPRMGPIATGLGEVFQYFVIGKGTDLTDVRTTQDWVIKPMLRPVPGTAEVNSWGGFEKQYQVRIDPTALLRHELTYEQVVSAVKANNLNVGGGSIDQSGDMLLVHGVGRTISTDQISNIVIDAKEGVAIRVRDIGEVTIGHEIRRGAVTATRRDPKDPKKLVQGEVVLGLSFMLMGQNSYTYTHDMREKFNTVQAALPRDGSIETVVAYDRTELVDRVIATVKNNLLEGAMLVILILYLFLGSLRAGLVCAAGIPMSMLFGFCGMWWFGISGSLLSLGAIDFGVVVDSLVVIVENVLKRLGHESPSTSRERLAVIRDAASEVRVPACFGQLIIMIVYLPLLTLEGVEGKMFRPMALTVVFVLIGSLICSLTLAPVLSSLVLPKNVVEKDVWMVRVGKVLYRRAIFAVLRMRVAVGLGALALLAAAGWLAMGMGSEFVPRLSEGAIVVGVTRPPGTSLNECMRLNLIMERTLCEDFPDEVAFTWSRLGSPEVPTDASTVEVTDLFVSLYPREQWRRATTQADLVVEMEKSLKDIPGQIFWFTQPIEQRINEMTSGVRADVALKLFGKDFDTLASVSPQLEQTLRGIPGCADLATEQMLGQPILRIVVKQDEIARYGMTAQSVLDLVQSIGSKELGQVVEGQLRFPLVARLPDSLRASPETIASITVQAPTGEQIPLSRLCEIKEVDGPRLISRQTSTRGMERRISIQCNVRGRDVGSFVTEAQRAIDQSVPLPEGYHIDWGGQFENMQRAQKRLSVVVPLALALIGVLLYFSFRNRFDTLAAFASVPFAAVGGVASLWWREMPLSISAAMGFITLSGLSVLNSMVFITRLREELRTGKELGNSIADAGVESLRTIVMTAMVASIGFLPMATSTGAGAEVQRPLATVVIGGVITSTLFSLSVLPVIYALRRRKSSVVI